MSELTKLIAEMAIITLKNLSDALLTTASEIRKLNHSSPPLSQASQKDNFASITPTMPRKLFSYSARDRVLVHFAGSEIPTKCRILKRISATEYLAYPQNGLKNSAREVSHEQILGLDPDK